MGQSSVFVGTVSMNKKQLLKLGVPEDCVAAAVQCLHSASKRGVLRPLNPRKVIPQVVASPADFSDDDVFASLAGSLIAYRATPAEREPIDFQEWGSDIDDASRRQMKNACRLPVARAAALMPDAHLGYGLPIGGVLACENAVVPYAVGVDIACRMRLTITDLDPTLLDDNDKATCRELDRALQTGTKFGVGKSWDRTRDHPVMDEDWTVTAVTRQNRDRAWKQLGTSGSGNHFVEWGLVELPGRELDIPSGRYVGLLSHSGSRGAGAQVCRRYTEIAQRNLPFRYRNDASMKQLAWLSLDSEAGQEYWLAMNLMGQYAAANHEVIHQQVVKLAGTQALATIENHHNFAWKERLGNREVVVHRKGATPAHESVLGVIPGTMADPAFLVRGRGVAKSVNSASHGAGRCMSRRAAKQAFRWHMWKDYLRDRNVRVLAGGLDEVPGAYKDIHSVMESQADLVDVIGEFHPKIVMMCGDGSPAED